jgi:hypothetical protein
MFDCELRGDNEVPEPSANTNCVIDGRRRRHAGLTCRPCRDSLDDRLADIPRKYGPLSRIEMQMPVVGPKDGGKRGKGSAAPIPIRLDVLNLTGPASPHDETTEPLIGSLPTLTVLESWERVVRDCFGYSAGDGAATVETCAAFLRAQLDRICTEDWVAQFAASIIRAHNDLKDVWGEHRPQPIGICSVLVERGGDQVECGARLFASAYTDVVRCDSCGETWDRDRWRLLGQSMGVIAS